jgi:hypothetical protein
MSWPIRSSDFDCAYMSAFVGVHLAAGVAKQCYFCSITGCKDEFDSNATGVTRIASITGWCTVGICLPILKKSVGDISGHFLSF